MASLNEDAKKLQDFEKLRNFSFKKKPQTSIKIKKRPSKLLSIDIKRPLNDIIALKRVKNVNNTNGNDLKFNDKTKVIIEDDPSSNRLKTISELTENLETFDLVEIEHHGEFYFDVNPNSIRFENNNGVKNTIVQVRIPKSFKHFEILKEIVYSHLYTKKNLSCKCLSFCNFDCIK